MSESESLKLEIDASGAKRGADDFTAQIERIGKALSGLERNGATSVENFKKSLAGISTAGLTGAVNRINSIKINTSVISELRSLQTAFNGFRGPSVNAAAGLELFGQALKKVKTPNINVAELTALGAALKGFRAPSALQSQNLVTFFNSLAGVRVPANIGQIVAGLNSISTAAKQARADLSGIGTANVGVPRALRGGGASYTRGGGGSGGGGGGGAYGPRGGSGRGPYDGIFSGEQRATGDIRGLENVANPGFQIASVARLAAPALTVGEGVKGIIDEGTKLTAFQHVLENATTIPDDAIESQTRLAESMQFVTDVAQKYGLNLQELRSTYPRFAVAAQAAGYGLQSTQQIFTDISAGLRGLGASAEVQTRVFRGFDQALQTGRFSMQQLHREIGLQIPAIDLMAKAISKVDGKKVTGLDVEAMSKKGQLIDSKYLAEFAHQIEETYKNGLPTAINSPVSALERLKNTFVLTMDAMVRGGAFDKLGEQFNRLSEILKRDDVQAMFMKFGDVLATAIEKAVDVIQFLSEHMQTATTVIKIFMAVGVIEFLGSMARSFTTTIGIVSNFASGINKVTEALKAMTAAEVAADVAAPKNAGGSLFGSRKTQKALDAERTESRLAEVAATRTGGSAAAAVVEDVGLVAAGGAAVETASKVGVLSGVLAPVIGLFTAIGEAAVAAFGIITGTVGIVVAAVAAIGAALYSSRDATVHLGETSTTVGSIYGGMWLTIKDNATSAFNWIKGIGTNLYDALAKGGSYIGSAVKTAVDAFGRAVQDFLLTIEARILNLFEKIKYLGIAAGKLATFDMAGAKEAFEQSKLTPYTPKSLAQQYAERQRQEDISNGLDPRLAGGKGRSALSPANYKALLNEPRNQPDNFSNQGVAEDKKSNKKTEIDKEADEWKRIMDAIDPAAKALAKYNEGLRLANDLEKAHKISAQEANIGRANLDRQFGDSIAKYDPQAKAQRDYENTVKEVSQLSTNVSSTGAPLLSKENAVRDIEAAAEAYKKIADPLGTYIELKKKEIAADGMTPKLRAEAEAVDKLNEELKKLHKTQLTPEQEQQVRVLADKDYDAKKDSKNDSKGGLANYANTIPSFSEDFSQFENKVATDFPKAFVSALNGNKKAWRDFLNSMVQDLQERLAKQAEKSILKLLFGDSDDDKKSAEAKAGGGGGSEGLIDKGSNFLSDKIFGVGADGKGASGGSSGLFDKLTGAAGDKISGWLGLGGDKKPQDAQSAGGTGGWVKNPQADDTGWQDVPSAGGGGGGSSGLFDKLAGVAGDKAAGVAGDKISGLLGLGGDKKTPQLDDTGWQDVPSASSGGGGILGSLSGLVGQGASALASGASSAASGIGGFISSILPALFSEGGYSEHPVARASMRAADFMNAPHYAEGTHNTSGGMPAILHPNEAVIPLSRGRKIPVEMGNSGGHTSQNVTMNIMTPDADSFRASENQIHSSMQSSLRRTAARNGA